MGWKMEMITQILRLFEKAKNKTTDIVSSLKYNDKQKLHLFIIVHSRKYFNQLQKILITN